MSRLAMYRILVLAASAMACHRVEAAKVCEFPAREMAASASAVRIAQIACDEHALWRRPFINAQGRIVRLAAMEGEKETLGDGQTPAWRRVAHYWKASGLLDNNVRWEKTQIEQGGQARRNGASDCVGDAQDWAAKAACRAFLIDVPWSAVFVSHVMKSAEISDFLVSSSHYYYIRDAARRPLEGPYRLVDPATEKPSVGDLVCYLREKNRVYGYRGLLAYLGGSAKPLDSHCDIVVGVDIDGDSKLYAIGGNVIHGVTMRKLNLNARGLLSLPMEKEGDDARVFEIGDEKDHNFNRQDWAALLKLNR
ncbi:MAG: DUF2272 domain-containing protein [Lysobacter sp.]|nr:DUF2272 domain-containing protein [Lysobacter sp.]